MVARQRQEGQRAAGTKALPGGGLVGELVDHIGHQGMLVVVPAVGQNAGPLPGNRIAAIRSHQQGGFQHGSPLQAHPGTLLARRESAHPLRAHQGDRRQRLQLLPKGQLGDTVLHDVAQVRFAHRGAVEANLPVAPSVPDVHGAIGAHPQPGHPRPGAQMFQHMLAGPAQGRDPAGGLAGGP